MPSSSISSNIANSPVGNDEFINNIDPGLADTELFERFTFVFDRSKFKETKKKCPHCSSSTKTYAILIKHLQLKVCGLGKYYAQWRKNHVDKDIGRKGFSRTVPQTDVQNASQFFSETLLSQENVFRDPSMRSDQSSECSFSSTASSLKIEHLKPITVESFSGETLIYDPSTNVCPFCGKFCKKRIYQHWTKHRKCPGSLLLRKVAGENVKFLDTEQKFVSTLNSNDKATFSETFSSHNEDNLNSPPIETDRTFNRTNDTTFTDTSFSYHGKDSKSTPYCGTDRSSFSTNVKKDKEMPIIITKQGISTTFDPSLNKCVCRVQPFSSVHRHWRMNRNCFKSLLFQEFVPKGKGFTKEPQWLGEPQQGNIHSSLSETDTNDISERTHDNWTQDEACPRGNGSEGGTEENDNMDRRNLFSPAQVPKTRRESDTQNPGRSPQIIFARLPNGEYIPFSKNTKTCDGCGKQFKRGILHHWTSNHSCTHAEIFQTHVEDGVQFVDGVQYFYKKILIDRITGEPIDDDQQEFKQSKSRKSVPVETERCLVCSVVVKNVNEHESESPICNAIRENKLPEEIDDEFVKDFVILRNAVVHNQKHNFHSLAETRDPDLFEIVKNPKKIGLKQEDREKMPSNLQDVVNSYRKTAQKLKIPPFPWDPKNETDEENVHLEFKKYQDSLLQIEFRKCSACNLVRLRTPIQNLEVCPNCPARKTKDNEDLLSFLKEYQYPDELDKLTNAESAILSYYQPTVNVTFSQQHGKRYRLQHLILTKQPNTILETITKRYPRPELEDYIHIVMTSKEAKENRFIMVRGKRIKMWTNWLAKNHSFFKEKCDNRDIELNVAEIPDGEWRIKRSTVKNSEIEVDNQQNEGEQEDSENDDEMEPDWDCANQEETELPQPELVGDTSIQTYISFHDDKFYQKANKIDIMRNDVIIAEKSDRLPVKDFTNTDLTACFPDLYPTGMKSPCNDSSHLAVKEALASLLHICVKKRPEFGPSGEEKFESENWFPFEENIIHSALVFAHAQNQEGLQKFKWFITKFSTTTRADLDRIFESMLQGPRSDKTFDTAGVPNFSSHVGKMKQSPQRWQGERKNIETIACESGEGNLFITLNMDIRHWYDVHNMLHLLIHNEPASKLCSSNLKHGSILHSGRPCFIPEYINNQKIYERISDRYAAKIEEYLFFRVDAFLKTWFHVVCAVPLVEGNWKNSLYENQGGVFWRRVEYTEVRGIQHWHMIVKLPGILHLPSLTRLLNRGRQARVELHKNNIKEDKVFVDKALEYIRIGLLAERYLQAFSDSLVHMSFEDEEGNEYDIERLRKMFDNTLHRSRNGLEILTIENFPLITPYVHVPKDYGRMKKRMADVAAASCIHQCITTACGGNSKQEKCRFGFPRKKLGVTVLSTICPNEKYTETHLYHKRTCVRTANTNKWALLYWGGNHDFQIIINFSQANRYVSKYVTKTKQLASLNAVVEGVLSDEDAFLRLSRDGALIQFFTAANGYRSELTRHQLLYLAMDLPESLSNFSITPVSIDLRTIMETKENEDGVEVVVDLVKKSLIYAYAERHNCLNDHNMFPYGIDEITLYEFLCITKKANWIDSNGKPAEKGYKNRNPNSGNKWHFIFHGEQTEHVRILNLKETKLAREYNLKKNANKTWEEVPYEEKGMLYRAYQELLLFVPWQNTLDETLLSKEVCEEVNALSDDRGKMTKKRLEAFMVVYQDLLENNLVAQPGTAWHRQNQYLFSMFLAAEVNKNVRQNRAENDGVFTPVFAPGNDETVIGENDVIYECPDEDCSFNEVPESGIEYELAERLENLPGKKINEIHVACPSTEFWTKHETWFKTRPQNSFLAHPPAPNVTYGELTPQQQFAYQQGVDPKGPQVIYITGLAGTGKTAVAKLIYETVTSRSSTCQVAAATAKAASQFFAPTFHGALGIPAVPIGGEYKIYETTIQRLQALYHVGLDNECSHFIIDEVNNLSAELLATAEEVLRRIFKNDKRRPWGGRKMIFLGDPLQLPPVKGANLINLAETEVNIEADKGDRKSIKKSRRAVKSLDLLVNKGRVLFKEYMEKNVIVFDKCHRSQGLLPRIMDEVRNARTTKESHKMITYLGEKFIKCTYDKGVYNENQSRELMNMMQTLKDVQLNEEPVFVSFAEYKVEKKTTERFLRSLRPQDFQNPVDDILLLHRGMNCTLVKNLNTRAGLTNGTVGQIVTVCYEQKDVEALLSGHHPQPYCVVVDFPDFRGYGDDDPDFHGLSFPVPTWVAIFPTDVSLAIPSGKQTRAMFSESDKKCRRQFPISTAKNLTAHKSQGQTWPNCIIYVSLGLKDVTAPSSEQTTLLYTAGTRSNKLKNCLFHFIPLKTWLNLGKSPVHQSMLKFEKKLKENAKQFALEKNLGNIYQDNLPYNPDLTPEEQNEWKEICAMTKMPTYPKSSKKDYVLDNFHYITTPKNVQGIIAFDLGPRNTGIAVIKLASEEVQRPSLLKLQHVDFQLPSQRPVDWEETMYAIIKEKLMFLKYYFVVEEFQNVDTWSIIIEYFGKDNSYKDSMFRTIQQVMNNLQAGTGKELIIKPCNTQMIHKSTSPIFRLNFTPWQLLFLQGSITFEVLDEEPFYEFDEDELLNPTEIQTNNAEDFHMPSDQEETIDMQPQDNSNLQKRKRKLEKESSDSQQPKKSRRQTTKRTKKMYLEQKNHSRRLMRLLASDHNLSRLNIIIPQDVKDYLNDLISKNVKLDDVGDAFLHACREAFCEPSKYRTFVPGQTLFQTNRCIAVRFIVRWFVFVVFHVENKKFTIEHVECYPTNLNQRTNLKELDMNSKEFMESIPKTFQEFLEFKDVNSKFKEVDTTHILLRHTSGSPSQVMLNHLKRFINKNIESRDDWIRTNSSSSFKRNRKEYIFSENRLVLVQETSGKHIDARQIVPTLLNAFDFQHETQCRINNMLSLDNLDNLFENMRSQMRSTITEEDFISFDNLVIPSTVQEHFMNLEYLKTNNYRKQNRAVRWTVDLILCALNHSVVRPYFKGSRRNPVK
jgi:hypothetical protein